MMAKINVDNFHKSLLTKIGRIRLIGATNNNISQSRLMLYEDFIRYKFLTILNHVIILVTFKLRVWPHY